MTLVTPQTGPEGRKVKKVLVAEACGIKKEYYAGIVLDRKVSLPVFMASSEGGVDIGEVAAQSPEKILNEHFSPVDGLRAYQGRLLAKKLGLGGQLIASAASMFVK